MSSQHITKLRALVSRKRTWHFSIERDPTWVNIWVTPGDRLAVHGGATNSNEAARFVLFELEKAGHL